MTTGKPFFLKQEFKPKHDENLMKNEGDTVKAREYFYQKKSHNLFMLLENRYKWMNKYIPENAYGIEVGSGTGISKEFIATKNYNTTDFAENPWLDHKNIDALNTGFADNEFDFVISSNMIHHVPYPKVFFDEMARVLKKDGVLIIQEINASFFMRLLLKLMRHEGYSYDVDVFDKNQICTDENDLWSANCAIPNLLFDNRKKFSTEIESFTMRHSSFDEFFCFLNSGGVIAKTVYIPLPRLIIRILQQMDRILAGIFPSVFALQRRIVLQKN